MENQKLKIGQIIYVIRKKSFETLSVGEVIDYGEDFYHVLAKNGKVFAITYPANSELNYLIVTRAEYIELLKKKQEKNMEIIASLEFENRKLEARINKSKHVCETKGHDYDDWKEDTWNTGFMINGFIPDTGVNYSVGNEVNGWSRTCKCCGHIERTTDKDLVGAISSRNSKSLN